MQIHERLYLNVFSQWLKFGKFPFAFLVRVMLAACVCSQVYWYQNTELEHVIERTERFSYYLIGTIAGTRSLLSEQELQQVVLTCFHNIFHLDAIEIPHAHSRNGTITSDNHVSYAVVYKNESIAKGIFEIAHIRDAQRILRSRIPALYGFPHSFAHVQLKSLTIDLNDAVETIYIAAHRRIEFSWKQQVIFDFSRAGRYKVSIRYTVDTTGSSCSYLNGAVEALSCISLLLFLEETIWARNGHVKIRPHLRSYAGRFLINPWWLVTLSSNFASLLASWRLSGTADLSSKMSYLGWSAFFSVLAVCQYYESHPAWSMIYRAASRSLPAVLRCCASMLPVLTAVMYLGFCHFYESKYFGSMADSYASLFALLNGDMVRDAMADLCGRAGIIGHVYVYLFIMLFIYIVLNINLTIVQQAFNEIQVEGATHEQATQDGEVRVCASFLDKATRMAQNSSPQRSSGSRDDLRKRLLDAEPDNFSGTAAEDYEIPTVSLADKQAVMAGNRSLRVLGHMNPRFYNASLQAALAKVTEEASPHGSSAQASSAASDNRSPASNISPAPYTPAASVAPELKSPELAIWTHAIESCVHSLGRIPVPQPRKQGAADDQAWKQYADAVRQLDKMVNDLTSALGEQE